MMFEREDGNNFYKQLREDANNFYKELRNRFKDKPDKFEDFMIAFRDSSKQRDFAGFATKMKKLLEYDKDLILKLNKLVPDRYKIKDINTSPKKRPNLEDANFFLRKIRAQFQGVDDHIYKSLIFILNMFYRKVKSFNEVYQEVTILLKDHPDLLDEFTQFLPEGIASQKTMPLDLKKISNSNSVANTGSWQVAILDYFVGAINEGRFLFTLVEETIPSIASMPHSSFVLCSVVEV